jgi:CRISPR-associated protein Cmr1
MKAPQSLPQPRRKNARGGRTLSEISVRVEVVTPILGGGFQTRTADEIDVIRAATVRGHLRFWWRALRGHEFGSPADLHAAESALWGCPATDEGGRSAVEIRVEVEQTSTLDDSGIRLYDSKDGQATPGAYALWPARAETEKGQGRTPPTPRRTPGARFQLTLIAPKDREGEIRSVVRAWILFGGYGSRTRRGLGSFKVVDDANAWLPRDATRDAFTALFGRDVFAPPRSSAVDAPWLAGASLHVGGTPTEAGQAWTTALDWLKEFRQGTSGPLGVRAREPGTGKPQPRRPSISNWPEADKVRHLKGKTNAHSPRHNTTPAWPRAGFGLPINGQFQKNARNGGRLDEPDGFELRWRSDSGEHDRLASPLIVKALPLADGTFVPCALWLNRAYPAGEVVLRGTGSSAAPFDRLVAPGDTARFSALDGKSTLRAAFLDWLRARYQTTAVAP